MTFLEMQTRVGELVNQAVTDDTMTVTETSVKANLNIGYSMTANVVDATYQDYYTRLAKSALSAGQSNYYLPTTCRKLLRVEIGYSSSTTRYLAVRIDRNVIRDPQYVFSETSPSYSIVGDNIELFPTPADTVASGLWLWYTKNITEMSDDTDIPDLPLGYEYIPVVYAAAKAKLTQGLLDEYEAFMAEFREALEMMRRELVERAFDGEDRVVITELQ